MEESNLIKAYIDVHGADAVGKVLIKYFLRQDVMGERLKFFIDYELGRAPEVDHRLKEKTKIRNHKVSLKRLRPIVLNFSLSDFEKIAEALITEAWWKPTQLKTLHFMLESVKLGTIQKGTLIKIIFSDNCFTFDRSEGFTTVRKRKTNHMTIRDCVQRAKNRFIDIRFQVEEVLEGPLV